MVAAVRRERKKWWQRCENTANVNKWPKGVRKERGSTKNREGERIKKRKKGREDEDESYDEEGKTKKRGGK